MVEDKNLSIMIVDSMCKNKKCGHHVDCHFNSKQFVRVVTKVVKFKAKDVLAEYSEAGDVDEALTKLAQKVKEEQEKLDLAVKA